MNKAEPFLEQLLQKRLRAGKEDAARLDERRGIYSAPRPKGQLLWIHAASVGEAQSALILVHSLLKRFPDARILVTTGTQSSAARMKDALPQRAFHQFIPLDNPKWCSQFLDHWHPDAAFWMESELWPNMLMDVKARGIPCALVNARLSKRSMGRWKFARGSIAQLLSGFDIILAQSEQDAKNFQSLGAKHAVDCGNIKYSAAPLSYNHEAFKALTAVIGARPVIVYASTHAGEEAIAGDAHSILEAAHPDLLSIIIPRHPERGADIAETLEGEHHGVVLRGSDCLLPDEKTRLYVADTLGEMGLFYRLSQIVYVGRSLSADGGGGHNPLEPALLNCAVIHGKNIQNLSDIYDDMQIHNACISADDKDALIHNLAWILSDDAARKGFMVRAHGFANAKGHVIDIVMNHLSPIIEEGKSDAA